MCRCMWILLGLGVFGLVMFIRVNCFSLLGCFRMICFMGMFCCWFNF